VFAHGRHPVVLKYKAAHSCCALCAYVLKNGRNPLPLHALPCPAHNRLCDAQPTPRNADLPPAAAAQEMEVKDFPTRVDVYPGMEHGFTLRPELKGDASDEVRHVYLTLSSQDACSELDVVCLRFGKGQFDPCKARQCPDEWASTFCFLKYFDASWRRRC